MVRKVGRRLVILKSYLVIYLAKNDKINDKIKEHQNNMALIPPDTILILKSPETPCGMDNTNRRSHEKLNHHNNYVKHHIRLSEWE